MDQREYYRFMGYQADVLRERYVPYADRFSAGQTVLDVGCGRGEFLELLAERAVAGVGVDADPGMVEAVRDKNLVAHCSDAQAYLEAHPDEHDGIFMAHVAEHLTAEALEAIIRAAARALRGGGRLIVVTPNPLNLTMHLHDFWIDLQHVRFYSPPVLAFLFEVSGLRDYEWGANPRYRLGPQAALDGFPDLSGQEPEEVGRRRRALGGDIPSTIWNRLSALESRVDLLSGWMSSLYPPGEYFVTGIRPADPSREAGGTATA